MVNDFPRSGSTRRAICCQVLPLESPAVLWSLPSRGDILDTGSCSRGSADGVDSRPILAVPEHFLRVSLVASDSAPRCDLSLKIDRQTHDFQVFYRNDPSRSTSRCCPAPP